MRFLFYFVVLLPATLVHAQHCRVAGQVFFADAAGHAITLKTDSGDLVNFSYDGATSFLAESGSQRDGSARRVTPEELNDGDLLCVGTSDPLVVTVTSRQAINAEQKKELAAWQADSLYGVVSGLDRKAQRIRLAVSVGGQNTSYVVDVSPNAAYWFFRRNAVNFRDAQTSSWDRIAPGDALYVRGTKGGAGQKFVASVIVSGGFRTFAATIETIEALDEVLHVHLVLSGNKRTFHIGPGELYAIEQAEAPAGGRTSGLHRIDAGDLQPGDTVLILGINDEQNSLRAGAVIVGFSASDILPPDPSQQMRWIFDSAPLGDATSGRKH